MKTLFTFTLLIFSNIVLSCEGLLNTDVKVLNKKEYKNLCEYDQKTILVVIIILQIKLTHQKVLLLVCLEAKKEKHCM